MSRESLQELLEEVLGSSNVYYQPPGNLKMNYPAIVYSKESIKNRYANDRSYKRDIAYKVTVIDKDPDSEIPEKIEELPMCSFDTHYISDNLYHDVFTLYY